MAKSVRQQPYAGIVTRENRGPAYTWNQSAGGTGDPLTHLEMDNNLVALDENAKNGNFWSGIKSENFAIDITAGGLFIDNPYNTGGGDISATAFDPATYVDYRYDSAAIRARLTRLMPSDPDSAHDFTIVQGTINSYKGDLKLQNGKIEYGTAGDQVDAPDQGTGLAFHDTQDRVGNVLGETMRLGIKQDLLIGTTNNPDMDTTAGTDYSKLRVATDSDVLVQFGTTNYGTAAADFRTTFLQLGGAGDTTLKSRSPGIKVVQNSVTAADWNLSLTSWHHDASTPAYVDALSIVPSGAITLNTTTTAAGDFNINGALNVLGATTFNATGPVSLTDVNISGTLTFNGGSTATPMNSVAVDVTGAPGIAPIATIVGPAGSLAFVWDTGYSLPTTAKQITWDNMLPKTAGAANHVTGDLWVDTQIRVDKISASTIGGNPTQLVLNAGESGGVATGQIAEKIYLNAEGGIEISSSSTGNWGQGGSTWANKKTTTINKDGIVTDGSVTAPGGFVGNASSATDATNANFIQVDGTNYRAAYTTASINTIAARDGSGDIYATRFRGEVIGNASTATNSQQFAASSSTHIPGGSNPYWLVNNWNGAYWRITSERPSGDGVNPNASVQHATVSDSSTLSTDSIVLRQSGTSTTRYAYIHPSSGGAGANAFNRLYSSSGIYVNGLGYFSDNVTLAAGKTLTGDVVGNASSATNATKIQVNNTSNYWAASTESGGSTIAARNSDGEILAAKFIGALSGNVAGNVTGQLNQTVAGREVSIGTSGYHFLIGKMSGSKGILFQNTVANGDARITHDATGNGRFVIYPALQLTSPTSGGDGTPDQYWLVKSDGSTVQTGGATIGGTVECDAIDCDSIVATGTISATGDITAFAASDKRLKDNISPIENALEKVASISGNTFDWNDKADKEGSEIGVIAQEIESLGLPGVTTTREDGYKAVRYEKLVPLLIEAIKELSLKVEELEK